MLQQILTKLESAQNFELLTQINRGIERECLRLDDQGNLAQTPHPSALGSALCHPAITTDFSESLLEFVTPVFTDIDKCLGYLKELHQFTYQHINDELIWMNSMPCLLPGITNIPIAEYGSSNSGRMKHIYRVGLSNRYGSAMQTISGIHYNFSVPDALLNSIFDKELIQEDISNLYMNLVRNFHRHCWLLLYLFGASPAVCKSFLRENDEHGLEAFDEVSFYGPEATTLRMSDLGYRNIAQSKIKIGLCNVATYIASLKEATERPYPEYEQIGVKVDDEYKQLNSNLLQIENEYYTVIRPKQVTASGEKPTTALKQRGIGYIEVRCLDINPNSPVGIAAEDTRFVDTLLLYCLFADSPVMSDVEKMEIPENRNRMVRHGRKPSLTLLQDGQEVSAQKLMHELLSELKPFAALLDQAYGNNLHSDTLADQFAKVDDAQLTPSAQIIEEMRTNDESFFEYAMRKTKQHETSLKLPLSDAKQKSMTQQARESLDQQLERETSDAVSFDDYLKHYFDETLET